jgi:hypothetical protein
MYGKCAATWSNLNALRQPVALFTRGLCFKDHPLLVTLGISERMLARISCSPVVRPYNRDVDPQHRFGLTARIVVG